jgi:hypothetical protein
MDKATVFSNNGELPLWPKGNDLGSKLSAKDPQDLDGTFAVNLGEFSTQFVFGFSNCIGKLLQRNTLTVMAEKILDDLFFTFDVFHVDLLSMFVLPIDCKACASNKANGQLPTKVVKTKTCRKLGAYASKQKHRALGDSQTTKGCLALIQTKTQDVPKRRRDGFFLIL